MGGVDGAIRENATRDDFDHEPSIGFMHFSFFSVKIFPFGFLLGVKMTLTEAVLSKNRKSWASTCLIG